jgi:ligand-binding sensor domain-containing protein
VKLCRPLLLFSFALLASGADRTLAQYIHKAWTAKDSAPPGIVAITQTTDGYLWLATGRAWAIPPSSDCLQWRWRVE